MLVFAVAGALYNVVLNAMMYDDSHLGNRRSGCCNPSYADSNAYNLPHDD